MINHIDELRKYVPIDAAFDIDNIASSKLKAEHYIRRIISPDIFDLAKEYYENKKAPAGYTGDTKTLDSLLTKIEAPFANLILYYRFIWLSLSVNNNGISVISTNNQKPANKGQLIEAKEDLLETSWTFITDLFDFLNKNDSKIKKGSEPIWSNTDIYKELKGIIFKDYSDFNKSFNTGGVVFFCNARWLISKTINTELKVRIPNIHEFIELDKNKEIVNTIKDFLAYRTIAEACKTFNLNTLPATIRNDIDREAFSSGLKDHLIRDRISTGFNIEADKYLRDIESFLNKSREIVPPSEDSFNESDKSVTFL